MERKQEPAPEVAPRNATFLDDEDKMMRIMEFGERMLKLVPPETSVPEVTECHEVWKLNLGDLIHEINEVETIAAQRGSSCFIFHNVRKTILTSLMQIS